MQETGRMISSKTSTNSVSSTNSAMSPLIGYICTNFASISAVVPTDGDCISESIFVKI